MQNMRELLLQHLLDGLYIPLRPALVLDPFPVVGEERCHDAELVPSTHCEESGDEVQGRA